jgi:NAD(P)H-dependent FMN reductase
MIEHSPAAPGDLVSKPVLQIIIASTRPGRIGLPVAQWFEQVASAHGGFEIEVVDLAEVTLPFFNEPNHPRLRQYTHQHTIDWSETIDRADAYVIVTPEYNYSFNAELKNALDYLAQEWARKPVGIVSYGGVAAGTRAVQQLKPVLLALQMTPTHGAVNIPFVAQFRTEAGTIEPNDMMSASADAMLVELEVLARTLEPLRKQSVR